MGRGRRWYAIALTMAVALFAAGCDEVFSESPSADSGNGGVQVLPTAEPVSESEVEQDVFAQVNDIRQRNGLAPLVHNEALAAVARNYSCRMAEEGFFDHEAPDGTNLVDRVTAAGISYASVGENIARLGNFDDPADAAIVGWWNSPSHREAMLKPTYVEAGVGVCRDGDTYFVTQNFLTPG